MKPHSKNLSLNLIFKAAVISQILFSVITTVYSSEYDLGRKIFYWLILVAFVVSFPSKSKKNLVCLNINAFLRLILLLVSLIQVIVVINLISNRDVIALSFISRDEFFNYDFLTSLHGGKIPFILRLYFKQIALIATILLPKNKKLDIVLIVIFWLTSVLISLVSGGRFVFLELLLFVITLSVSRKILRWLVFSAISVIIGITYSRIGNFHSLLSSFIGLDFAYEVSEITPDFGYFSHLGIIVDNLNGMSHWSWMKYGTFLDEFLYYNPILDSSFNAYGTIFIIPLTELGMLGLVIFLLTIFFTGWILRDTVYSDGFLVMLIMGLFQFNLLWYPVVYLFGFAIFARYLYVR